MTHRCQAEYVEEIAETLILADANDKDSLSELLSVLDTFLESPPQDCEAPILETLKICKDIINDIYEGNAPAPESALQNVSKQIVDLQQSLREKVLKPVERQSESKAPVLEEDSSEDQSEVSDGAEAEVPSEVSQQPEEQDVAASETEPSQPPSVVDQNVRNLDEQPGATFELPEWVEEQTFQDFLSARKLTLEEIEGDILAVEESDTSSVSSLLRRIHTLKGEAGALGLEGLELVCHALEDRLSQLPPGPQWADVLFMVKDWVDSAMESYAKFTYPEVEATEIIQKIKIFGVDEEVTPEESVQEEKAEEPAEPTAPVCVDPEIERAEAAEGGEPQGEAGFVDRDEETVALLAEFLQESEEGLSQCDSILMNIEHHGLKPEMIDALFRVYHTIKGVAGFLELGVVESLAHTTENLLNKARKDEIDLSGSVLDLIFDSTEVMRNLLRDIREAVECGRGFMFGPEADHLVLRLKASIDGSPPPEAATPFVSRYSKNSKVGEILVQTGTVTKEDVDAALEKQKTSGKRIGEELVDAGVVAPKEVAKAIRAQNRAAEPQHPGAAHPAKLKETVKVDLERVDSLVEMVGELVIVESMLAASPELSGVSTVKLQKYLSQLGKISRDLQSVGMQLRMIPLRGVFQKMARLVRDLSKKSNKKVRLIQSGESTEMDRSMVEQISDPLVHMIRNSVDHGVEPPEDRKKAGKTEEGAILLSAYHEGSSIVISIRDDGRGLDRDAIVKKAISQGLIRTAEHLTDSEVFNLVFAPGFSTAQKVTQISGRGVGMDVVRKNIEAMRGRIGIESVKGQGTEFKLILPLTLAIIDGMLVQCGTEQYIIPTLSIIESIQPERSMLYSFVDRHELVDVRGEIMPLLRLNRLLDVTGAEEDPTKALIIVVETVGQKVGLLVDDVLTQQQVVIKNLGSGFKDATFLAGATILSDGRAGLILNVDELGALGRAEMQGVSAYLENGKESLQEANSTESSL